MKRILIIIIIALVTVAVMLLIFRPELLDNIWLWIVGLIGAIVGYSKTLIEKIKKWTGTDSETEKPADDTESIEQEEVNGKVLLSLLRYSDDGNFTTGMLYLKDEFFCFTIEEPEGQPGISPDGRISPGKYPLGFDLNETDFTLKYRQKFNWFKFHLQIKKTGKDSQAYIHCGCTNSETINGIMIVSNADETNVTTLLKNSERLYEHLYSEISDLINKGEPIFIQIYNKNWFSDRFC